MRHKTDITDLLKPVVYLDGWWLMKATSDEFVMLSPSGFRHKVKVDFRWDNDTRHGYNYFWMPVPDNKTIKNVDIESLFAEYVRTVDDG